jgi:histidinol-phosphate aminotransferase
LGELGFDVCPSAANFLFVKPPLPAAVYQQKLREHGVLVRYFSAPQTADYVRITIGTDAEMSALLDATRTILGD